jgi:hypothetical protein
MTGFSADRPASSRRSSTALHIGQNVRWLHLHRTCLPHEVAGWQLSGPLRTAVAVAVAYCLVHKNTAVPYLVPISRSRQEEIM